VNKFMAVLASLATAALFVILAITSKPAVKTPSRSMAALSQTYIALNAGAPLRVPPLVSADGGSYGAKQLQGHWSVIFFGFTACALVCPKTLSVLTAVARDPASGISSGATQAAFVSVDPENDTPQRLSNYLKHFDSRIVGLTGSREAIGNFSREIGAGYQPVGSAIDHSTSLFVVDPQGRLAGILLRPNKPAVIVADLATLRRSHAQADVAEMH
jgi:protein SCO1